MLAKAARLICNRLALALALPEEAAERAAFALENLMFTLLSIGAVVAAASLSGLFWPTIIAAASGAVMRLASGGAHFSGPWRCILVSTILALLFGLAGRAVGPFLALPGLVIIAIVIALPGSYVLIRFGPAETPAKPVPRRQRALLKGVSLAMLALWVVSLFLLPWRRDLAGASAAGLVWQIFSITPAGYGLYHWFDRQVRQGREVSESA